MPVDRTNANDLANTALSFFAWVARFRCLACDYERLPETLADFHFLTFTILMLRRLVDVMA
jgi:transposase